MASLLAVPQGVPELWAPQMTPPCLPPLLLLPPLRPLLVTAPSAQRGAPGSRLPLATKEGDKKSIQPCPAGSLGVEGEKVQGKGCRLRVLEEVFWGVWEMKVQIQLWGERCLEEEGF